MRYLLITLSCICIALGVIGMILPVMPTTPFLLLASWLFLKSSPELHRWLLNHKILGIYIRNYEVHKAIPLRAKIVSISLLWATILSSAIFFVPIVWVKFLLIGIAIAVTIHLLRFKTLSKEDLKAIEQQMEAEKAKANSLEHKDERKI